VQRAEDQVYREKRAAHDRRCASEENGCASLEANNMRFRVWLLLSLLAGGIACLYMFRILGPWEQYIDVKSGKLEAEMGDLYPRWVGTRELLLHGRNPYSPEVSHEIQIAFYGHAIDQQYGPGTQVVDEQRFVYPVYVVFLLAPAVYLQFWQVQILAVLLFGILTAISVILWMEVLRLRPPKALVLAIILFVLSSPQIVQGLRLRQLGLVVAFLLAMSAWCIVRDQLAIAGIFLAISTIKPQMVVLPLAWFLLWAASAAAKRWPLLAGFGVTLTALTGLGEFVLPGWLRYFVDGLIAYRRYFPTTSLLCLALGNWVGGMLTVIAMVALIALAWRNRRVEAGAAEFAHTLGAVLIGGAVVLPLFQPFNQVLLLLPVMLVVRGWPSLSRVGRRIFAAAVSWPWIVSLVLLVVFHPRVDSSSRIPLLPSAMTLFVPFLLLALLATRLVFPSEREV
jgi:hypothetical protein